MFKTKTFITMCVIPIFMVTVANTNVAIAEAVVTPSIADVSSENPVGIDRGAGRTIDGSGLTGNGSSGSTHSNYGEGTMWTSQGSYASDYDPYITFDLGVICDVETMRIWNFNYDPYTYMDVATMEVFAGASLGAMTPRGIFTLAQATGANDYTGEDFAVDFTGVRYIMFDILTSHDGAIFGPTETGSNGGADGRSLTGLSEVRFDVPEKVVIDEPDGTTIVYESGITDSYDIYLAQQPTTGATVAVTATPADPLLILNTALAGDPVTLTFNDQDWNVPQMITVTAAASTDTTTKDIVISHTASSTDTTFDGALISSVSVTYFDGTCGLWGYNRMDFDRDCHVGLGDFAIFLSEWLE